MNERGAAGAGEVIEREDGERHVPVRARAGKLPASRRRTVVITGASAGVGRATARAFADQGARIGLVARGRGRLGATAREVEERGGEAILLPADVADAEAVEAAADRVEEAFGPIDVWVNNAMVTVFSPVREMEAAEYRRVTEVTYLGVVHGTLAALRRMLPRDRGRIIQVGSALAYRAIPLQSAYCAAKHAVEGFTESLRTELYHEGSGVIVQMVQMPALNTPQFDWVKSRMPKRPQPVPPIFQPEVAAEAILYVSETDRPEIYVGGPAVKSIVGNRIAPRLLDRYLARKGIESQLTDEAEDPDRPHNLWEPVEGDWAARGRFDHRAEEESLQMWASRNRGLLATAGAVVTAGVAAGVAWLGRGESD